MTTHGKLLVGGIAVAVVAVGGAAFAAVELIRPADSAPAPLVTAPWRGIEGSGLAGGALGGRGFTGGLGPGEFADGFGGLPGRGLFWATSAAAAASYLGLSPAALRAALLMGETLAQVARAHGSSAAGLVAALVAAYKTRLDGAVARGFLTPAQARAIESRLQERAAAVVDGTRPPGFGARFGAAATG
jgi:hypothetical protein